MDEFGLINRYFSRWRDDASVVCGIGDDAAVTRLSPGHELVSCVDALVEGVHFLPAMNPADIGYRLVAVNLSDFAAMGAIPRWMTLSLSIPEVDETWLADFAAGMRDCAEQHDVSLIGGDTTRASQTTLSLQMIGEVPAGEAILRQGAKVGDSIFVTGSPGNAKAGLEREMRGESSGKLYDAFARPSSRVLLGQQLRGKASAAIDLSDGLFADLGKLVSASGVAALIHQELLPVSEDLLEHAGRDNAIEFVLAGGDDYELCFTASDSMYADRNAAVTRIGEITEGTGVTCLNKGAEVSFDDKGYRHFR